MKIMKTKIHSRKDAIREKCKDCCCGDLKEIRDCHLKVCSLWPYRMGREVKGNEQTLE